MAMIPLIILGIVLAGCITILVSMMGMEAMRNLAPYTLFKLHAKLTTRGLYRVKRSDDSFKIKAGFSEMRVTQYEWKKERIHFVADSGYKTLFNVKYNVNEQKIEEFDCSPAFAKGVNNHNFLALLEGYIPYVLEHEMGKKSDHVLAVEKMKTLGASFQPKKQEPSKQKEDKAFKRLNVSAHAYTIQSLVRTINEVAENIHQNKQTLELEEQHDFETLVQKRLPNVLKFANVSEHEQEVVRLLEDVLHKLRAWEASLTEEKTIHFEREVALIKKITQR